jgi:trimethylamine:corrinoid methyltransferase-like protein
MVEKALFHCRNSADRKLSGKNLIFSCDCGSGHLYDYTLRERRIVGLSDLVNACRLADALENIDEVSFPVYPQGVPYKIMDLVIWKTVWTYTRKEGGGGLSRNAMPGLILIPNRSIIFCVLPQLRLGERKN